MKIDTFLSNMKKEIQPQMFDFSFIHQKNQNKQQKIGHNLYQGG